MLTTVYIQATQDVHTRVHNAPTVTEVLSHGLDVQCDQVVVRVGGCGGLVLNGQRCSPSAPLNQIPHCVKGGQNALPVRIVHQPEADLHAKTYTLYE